MEHNLFPRIVPFFIIVIFILIHLPTSLCVKDEYYTNCSSSSKCCNISITYPFWGGNNRPDYCGYPGIEFNLHCQNGVLTMNMKEITYRVLDINYSTHTVIIARNDYWDTYCPTAYFNTTIDSQIFRYNSTTPSILMNYGCPSSKTRGDAKQEFTCVINGTNTLGYYLTMNYNDSVSAMFRCDTSVIIPVSQSAAETLNASRTQENLIVALHGGFELKWRANNDLCSACVKEAGGQCGYNNITSAEFTCYCPDSPFYPY